MPTKFPVLSLTAATSTLLTIQPQSGNPGSAVVIQGGGGGAFGSGGPASLLGGIPSVGGNGGGITITGANGGTSTGTGGTVAITAGNSLASNLAGALVTLTAGNGNGTGAGGANTIRSGNGGVTGAGGLLAIFAGAGGTTSGNGGAINLTSGSSTSGTGGTFTLNAGSATTGTGGSLNLNAGTGSTTAGTININGADRTSGAAGNIILRGGRGSTSANDGVVRINRTTTDNRATRLQFIGDDNFAVNLKAPATIGTSYELILPDAQGAAATFLQNDGSGNLSWAAGGGGGITGSGTDSTVLTWLVGGTSIQDSTATAATVTLGSGAGSGAGAGNILNVTAGQGGATGTGGAVNITGGSGGATSGAGGTTTIKGGDATTSGLGGALNLLGGAGVGTAQAGGAISITGGAPGTTGAPGTVTVAGAGFGAGGTVGANVILRGGRGSVLANDGATRIERTLTDNRATRLQFVGDDNDTVSVKAPAAITASYELILPVAQGGAATFLRNDGAGTLSWASSVVTTPTTIYINTAGSDANDGTSGNPVATMARAAALSPQLSNAPVIWRITGSAASFAWAECPTLFGSAGRWTIYCEPSTRVGPSGAGAPTTGLVAGAGTDHTTIKGTFTVNEFQHVIVEMTSGAGSGYRRTVQQCTLTDLIPVRQFENQDVTAPIAVASGDTYSLYRPGVVITGFTGVRGKRILLWDVAFDTATSQNVFDQCDVYGSGVEFRGTIFPHFVGCSGSFGQWDNIDFTAIFTISTAMLDGALPTSVARSTEIASWFLDVGLANSLVTLAQHRGCGVSCPSVVAVFSATTEFLQLLQCRMSLHGTFAAVGMDGTSAGVGGFFWGTLSVRMQSSCLVTGRSGPTAPSGAAGTIPESTVTKRRVDAIYNSLVVFAAPWSSIPNGFGSWLLEDNSTILLAANGNVIGTSVLNDLPGSINRGSTVRITGTTTINSNINASAFFGVPSILEGSRLFIVAATTINNTGSRALLCIGRAQLVLFAQLTFVGSGGVRITEGSYVEGLAPLVVTNGPALIERGSQVIMSANMTVSGQPGDGVTVDGAEFQHVAAGILSVVATAGKAMVVKSGRVILRDTTNAVLTGSAGNPGLQVRAGGQVNFAGAPTSVTVAGSNTDALQIGPLKYSSSAELTVADTFITDGAGTSIWRSA